MTVTIIKEMRVFSNDPYLIYLCAASIILLTTVFVKITLQKELIHRETGRKILHFVAIMSCAYVVDHTDSRLELAAIFFFFSAVLFYIAHHNILLPSARKSYGIALFPLAFGILLCLPLPLESLLFGMITLGISDALAGVTGEYLSRNKHVFLYEQKSWLGFSVFYFSTIWIGYFFIGFTPLLIILALVPAFSELFSIRGSDNLSVPIISSVWISVLQDNQNSALHWFIFCGMLLIMGMAYYKKWLSMTGSSAAILLGTLIIFSAGPLYLVPISIFFIAGSLSSRLHPKSKDASGRNAFQVFANGLIAVVALLVYSLTGSEVFLLASFASVAVSLADTLSSDIGIYFKNKTYDITTFRPVKAGLSGGISVSGTLAGIIGSLCLSWLVGLIYDLDNYDKIIIGTAGIAGMFLDSILGSLWQAKYMVNDEVLEEKKPYAILIKGNAWLDNDGVNLTANLLVVGVLVFCLSV